MLGLDRHDLRFEGTGIGGRGCPFVGFDRELIELRAVETPLLGDHLRADSLVGEHTVIAGEEALAVGALAHERGAHRVARHRLDATGDDGVVVAGDESGGGEVHRLL